MSKVGLESVFMGAVTAETGGVGGIATAIKGVSNLKKISKLKDVQKTIQLK